MSSDKVKFLKIEMGAVRVHGWDIAVCFAYIRYRRQADLGWLPSEAKLLADLCGPGYTIPVRAIRQACRIFKEKNGINQRMRRMPYKQQQAIKATIDARNVRT